MRNYKRVDGRTASSTSSEQCCTSSERLGQGLRDVASFEEPILGGVPTGVTFQAFHQDDRRYARRPEAFLAKSENEGQSPRRPLGEATDAARI